MSSTTTVGGPALQASGLTVSYRSRRRGQRPALDGCGFEVPAGSICAVVGVSGAGKSTLLETAAGLRRPSAGSLSVLGLPPGAARSRVAYLAQDRPLPSKLSVKSVLRMGAELNPGCWDAAFAAGIVEQGGLDRRARVDELSGGQLTRLAFALALGKRPELLLLDEPMADLDLVARHQLMGVLLAHCVEYGATALLSSHLVSELADSCDRLLLLKEGRVVLAGGIEELLATRLAMTGVGAPDELSLEELVLAHLGGFPAPAPASALKGAA
ncbi:ABC transporter ATP-binding protein [Streptacidiphilus carbonis]|uniref:ABC transporter ATP-binding protein n=1 Tax=Streptacidiphilus carbonis TaxID=105422 RepID=UPI0005A92974|nr:ABC transporter ATP-binding protein [Streptacidiphilus carbonis]